MGFEAEQAWESSVAMFGPRSCIKTLLGWFYIESYYLGSLLVVNTHIRGTRSTLQRVGRTRG